MESKLVVNATKNSRFDSDVVRRAVSLISRIWGAVLKRKSFGPSSAVSTNIFVGLNSLRPFVHRYYARN